MPLFQPLVSVKHGILSGRLLFAGECACARSTENKNANCRPHLCLIRVMIVVQIIQDTIYISHNNCFRYELPY